MFQGFQGIVVSFLVGLVMTALGKSEGQIQWDVLESEAETKVKALPFGSFVDESLLSMTHVAFAVIKSMLSGPVQQEVMNDAIAGKWGQAFVDFEAAVQAAVVAALPKA